MGLAGKRCIIGIEIVYLKDAVITIPKGELTARTCQSLGVVRIHLRPATCTQNASLGFTGIFGNDSHW
jgi:hypothetical protein